MIINIAVAEDEREAIILLENHIAKFKDETGIECRLTVFKDGLNFLEKYKPVYDVVFLDIDMPFLNGIDAAEKLRVFDSNVPIVFITNLKQYALKGYTVQAADFLVKPVNYAAFSTMLNRIADRIGCSCREITIQNTQGTFRVRCADIFYLEVLKHYIVYHTVNGEIRLWGSLSEEESRLSGKNFARCNNCYLVNLASELKI